MNPGSGKATASLVLGIISLIGICSPIIGVVCGIVAIVLSRMSVKRISSVGISSRWKSKSRFDFGYYWYCNWRCQLYCNLTTLWFKGLV